MKILIDGRTFVVASTGITTFLKGCLTSWAKASPSDTFIVALPKHPDPSIDTTAFPANVQFLHISNWLLQRLPNLIWLITMMPVLARRFHADLYFSPVPCIPFFLPRRMKTLITVHDVVNIEFQQTMQWTNIIANKLLFSRSVKKADRIWTNSHYTRKKIEQYFPLRKCQTMMTGCAVDRQVFRPLTITKDQQDAIRQRHGINGRFLLFVGSLEPRKNLEFLLRIMPEVYHRYGVQLVVVGGKGWKNSSLGNILSQPEYPKACTRFCGYITNSELAELYNMAACFISASLNEGFGMPQLEALLCDCPVITSHNSAMIEVAGDKKGATTVEGYEPETWVKEIGRVLKELPEPDPQELAEYDWDTIVGRFKKYLNT